MEKPIIVIGAGGHCKVVINTINAMGEKVVNVFDDSPEKWGQKILGVEICGPVDKILELQDFRAVIAIGDNKTRKKIAEILGTKIEWFTAIHPFTSIAQGVEIGEGSVIFAGSVIQPDVKIGNHAVVNTSVSIDHDCILGDFCQLAPGVHLSGTVEIGECTFIGTGTATVQNISVGENSFVGAGSLINRNLPGNSRFAGVPARKIWLN